MDNNNQGTAELGRASIRKREEALKPGVETAEPRYLFLLRSDSSSGSDSGSGSSSSSNSSSSSR